MALAVPSETMNRPLDFKNELELNLLPIRRDGYVPNSVIRKLMDFEPVGLKPEPTYEFSLRRVTSWKLPDLKRMMKTNQRLGISLTRETTPQPVSDEDDDSEFEDITRVFDFTRTYCKGLTAIRLTHYFQPTLKKLRKRRKSLRRNRPQF